MNESFFIISIRAILNKYQHYPELHMNILIILFQTTTNLDYDLIVYEFYLEFDSL